MDSDSIKFVLYKCYVIAMVIVNCSADTQ